ncbi:phosphopantetheine-binding protein [Streptomyces sp. enrichment culture]|uniref:phosphopantetheine-binding protein n=1 Tax=Streptomyces sp. enrichment culture TaxID=1795815 RepID=UPI003F55B459
MSRAVESTLPEELVTLLTDHLDLKVAPASLTPSASFESLDVDSLALMELVVAAEEEFGIILPEETLDLSPASTLAEAARAFDEARRAR